MCVSEFTGSAIFARKTTFYLKMLDIQDTAKKKNCNIHSLKYNFKTLRHTFWADQNYFKFFCNVKLELRKTIALEQEKGDTHN